MYFRSYAFGGGVALSYSFCLIVVAWPYVKSSTADRNAGSPSLHSHWL